MFSYVLERVRNVPGTPYLIDTVLSFNWLLSNYMMNVPVSLRLYSMSNGSEPACDFDEVHRNRFRHFKIEQLKSK